ncbi:anaerobic sulfatase maturase [Beggiatoa leptomitoformis]|uniref:Anaerobic sulfatase maturase n=1 Tax=Beggiatoa leptomitoformis TaxID=288004 RepID=A0A2N9YJJ5_9GAMM|nr:anaerobic sulfatase maturase [Beggiatoa leptomitoformis]ALG69358.2 anaerobic sulfatase maturase [Beggiatoa leptomitoformis]AUI70707.2 anaerobic sulfatase maturase [Beggiatoa leptomitoformis]
MTTHTFPNIPIKTISTAKSLRSILIKPMGSFCNLRCEYCFYLDKHHLYAGHPSAHRMNDETLEKLIIEMFSCADNPSFIWQGGEPTVLGVDFFRKVVALQKKWAQGRHFANALQTSGFLLDEEWADFLQQEQFLVGISLDGTEHIHDHYRKDRQGQGTFKRVFANAQLLLQKGVAVNVLATVNDYSVQYAKEIYDFFVKNGFIFMQFSPIVERHPTNPKIAAPFSVSARNYGRFLNQLFDVWLKDFDFNRLQQKTSIRFFDGILQTYIGIEPDHCVLHERCNDYLVVEYNGDLFSCDFLVSQNTRVGNLHETPLKMAFDSAAHTAFGERKAQLDAECRQCEWLTHCYGGCVKDRIRDPNDKGHNHFCESYKLFFKHTNEKLKQLAKLYQQHYS